jgi:hypothetical protein
MIMKLKRAIDITRDNVLRFASHGQMITNNAVLIINKAYVQRPGPKGAVEPVKKICLVWTVPYRLSDFDVAVLVGISLCTEC